MKTASVETGVRIPVGTPTAIVTQVTEKSGDASEKEASPFSFPEVRGQKFYPLTSAAQDGISTDASVSAIPAVQKSEADSLNSEASVTNTDVRLRSQPIQINPITYDSGNPGYLVVGTVVPKQKPWREKFRDRAEAELRQREWEDERIRMAAGMQMRATELSNNALRDAEAALKAARILGFPSLLEAVMAVGKPSPAPAVSVSPQRSYKQLFDEFVAFHKDHASKSQSDKVRQTAKLFGDDIGWDTSITGIETSDVQKWVKAHTKNLSKKTFNNVLNDVSRVFSWAAEPAQKYLTENPAAAIPRYNSRVLAAGAREIIKVETCQKLMAYLEEHHPEWVFSFALMLFAGVRPGYHDGEIAKLMRCANRDGIETYISGGMLLLTAKITKDRRPRQLPMPPNLVAWITRYMPKKGEFRLGDRDVYAEIRARFKIPHDGLRHTAISAHVTKHGSFAMAALEFGNSEKVIRTHYYSRMLREDADAFYEIWPRAA